MDIIELAEKRNLKVKKLEGELIIPGRKVKRNDGSYSAPNPRYPLDCLLGRIFEFSSNRMGLVFMPRRPKVWMNMSRKLVAAGFEICQNGDWEGTVTFDPGNPVQVRLAIKCDWRQEEASVNRGSDQEPGKSGNAHYDVNPPDKTPTGDRRIDRDSRGYRGGRGNRQMDKNLDRTPIRGCGINRDGGGAARAWPSTTPCMTCQVKTKRRSPPSCVERGMPQALGLLDVPRKGQSRDVCTCCARIHRDDSPQTLAFSGPPSYVGQYLPPVITGTSLMP